MKFLLRYKAISFCGFLLVSGSVIAQEQAETPKNEIAKIEKQAMEGEPGLGRKAIRFQKIGDPLINAVLAGFASDLNTFFTDLVIEEIAIFRNDATLIQAGYPDNVALTGSVRIDEQVFSCRYILAYDAKGVRNHSFTLELPEGWKFSQLLPELKNFDEVDLPHGRFILSTFEYEDPFLEWNIKKGFTFQANLNLSGPFEDLGKLVKEWSSQKAKLGDAVSLGAPDDFVFEGVFSPKLVDSRFSAIIPVRLGLDFEKLYQAGKIKDKPTVIKSITSGDLILSIAGDLSFSVDTGVILGLFTQPDPIELRAAVSFSPLETKFSAYMIGMFDPAFGQKWLALGEFSVDLIINYEALPVTLAVGIPFTGLGLRGAFGLGEGADRRVVELAGLMGLGGETIGNFVLSGKINKLTLEDLFPPLRLMSGSVIPKGKLPAFELHDVELSIAAKDTYIATKLFEGGISVVSDFSLDGKRLGRLQLLVDPETKKLKGLGYLANIETDVFRLTGAGLDKELGTADDGPIMELLIDPENDMTSCFLDGRIEVPPLNISQGTHVDLGPSGGRVAFDVTIADLFDMNIDFTLDVDQLERSEFKLEMANNFNDVMIAETKKAMQEFQEKARADIAQWDEEIANARKGFEIDAQSELKRVNERIAEIEKHMPELKQDCFKVPLLKRIGRKSCTDFDGLNVEKNMLIIYRDTILKPGTQVVKGTLDITQKIAELEGLKKAALGIVDGTARVLTAFSQGINAVFIRKAAATFSAEDLAELALPRLDVLEIVFNIPGLENKSLLLEDVQIDFKHPIISIRETAVKIVKSFVDLIKR